MPRRLHSIAHRVAFIAAACLAFDSSYAVAASGSWNTNNSGSWNSAANWSPNTAVPGTTAGDVVGLVNNISANRTVTINTAVTLGTLNIGDSDASHSFTLTGTTSGSLTFNNNGSGASIVQQATSNANLISTGFTLADNLTITNNQVTNGVTPLYAMTVSGNIAESGGTRTLTKTGVGTVFLSGSNTYSGKTTVNAGTLQFVNPTSLYGGTTAEWTAAKVAAASGATLAVSVGSSNFTTGNVTALLTNLGGLGGSVASGEGLQAGSSIGFDTSNAGGSFTVADALKNSTGAGGGAIGLVKLSSGTLSLTGLSTTAANNYTGTTIIDQGTLVLANGTKLTGGLTFGSAVGSTNVGTLDLSNGSAEFGGNMLVRSITGTNSISIGAGQSLTSKGNVQIGDGTGLTGSNPSQALVVQGSGTWNVTTSNGTFRVGNASASRSVAATLDASQLAALNIDLRTTTGSTGGTFLVGDAQNGTVAGQVARLAATTTLKAASLTVQSAAAAGVNQLLLGTGSQVVNANFVTIGNSPRASDVVQFQDAVNGTLMLRNAAGSGRASLGIGSINVNISGSHTATLSLAGHSTDLLLSNVSLMEMSGGSGLVTSVATLTFDSGTFDAASVLVGRKSGGTGTLTYTGSLSLGSTSNLANTATIGPLSMAVQSSTTGTIAGVVNIAGTQTAVTITSATLASTSAVGGDANGTLNISGGSTMITGGITLVNRSGTPGTASATLNLTGGSLSVGGNVATAGSGGTITSTVTLDGGSLNLNGNALGGVGQLITNLSLRSGTLSNVGQINDGAGLVKTTAGTLTLSGSNGYTGGNQIDGGTLRLASSNALGSAANALALNSGTLDLGGQSATIGLLNGSAGTVIRSSVAGSAILTANSAASSTFAGQITDGSGVVGLSKQGTGLLTLTAANTYTGTTLIGGGTLALASGASLASSLITVGTASASTSAALDVSALSGGLTLASSQTIGGKGTIFGDMVVGGGAIVSPGNSTGLLTETGTVTFAGGGRYMFEINNAIGTAGSSSGWDLFDVGFLSVTATATNPFYVDLVTLTSAQTPGLADGFDPNGTYYWLFLDAGSAITTWDATAFQINSSGFQNPTSNAFGVVRGDQSGVGGTDQQLYITYIGVPEPGSVALASIGIAAAGWTLYRRRRRRCGKKMERQPAGRSPA